MRVCSRSMGPGATHGAVLQRSPSHSAGSPAVLSAQPGRAAQLAALWHCKFHILFHCSHFIPFLPSPTLNTNEKESPRNQQNK